MSWHFSQELGGGILGGALLGWTTVGAVEIEKYPRECLLQRQRDGLLPPFPVWDDVCTFNGKPWRGLVDVVSGGFPCQDISSAGKGAGITGTRSGLWKEMHRIICEVRPRYAFMENSPMLTSRGLGTVLGDLAESGYDAAWLVLGASDVGAPHHRKRIWILAEDTKCNMDWHADRFNVLSQPEVCGGTHTLTCGICADVEFSTSERFQTNERQSGDLPEKAGRRTPIGSARASSHVAYTNGDRREEQWRPGAAAPTLSATRSCSWWSSEPNVGRVAHGVASRVDRLKAIGNGQVPLVAATAFLKLRDILDNA